MLLKVGASNTIYIQDWYRNKLLSVPVRYSGLVYDRQTYTWQNQSDTFAIQYDSKPVSCYCMGLNHTQGVAPEGGEAGVVEP